MESGVAQHPNVDRVVEFDASVAPSLVVERVEARRITMAAGVAAGRHLHNGPVVGSVVRGTVKFQIEGQPPTLLSPGDVFFEPANVPIDHFDAQNEEVEFVAFFPLAADQNPQIAFPAEGT